MPVILQQPDLQLRTLRLYGELLCRRESWAHQLAFACFAGAGASGLAAAASLAGAASLVVDADAAVMKAHFRDGAYDFVVNTLDEALRAIKNELRQGHPIAIGLIADPAAVLREAIERGLAAAFVLEGAEQNVESLRGICEVEAVIIHDDAATSEELNSWLATRDWCASEVPSTEVFEESVRQKWMLNLPALQRSVRQSARWAWATSPSR